MSAIKVIFWSGTGNTEAMADAVVSGIEATGGEANKVEVSTITADEVAADTVFAMGCPSMGDEVLEESDFEPFMEALDDKLAGKKVALFGSYGWGDGEWMRNWEARVTRNDAVLVAGGLIANDAPDEDAIAACKTLGEALVKAV